MTHGTTTGLALALASLVAADGRASTFEPVHVVPVGVAGDLVVAHDHGLSLVSADGSSVLACTAGLLPAEAEWVMHTGADRILVAGEPGPYVTDTGGCHWKGTFGTASARAVVGLHQRVPGGLDVLFALRGDGAMAMVARSVDGGLTSEPAGELGLVDTAFVGMVGQGDDVVVVGLSAATGVPLAWRSSDAGATFDGWDAPGLAEVGEALSLVGLGPDALWVQAQETVFRVDLGSGQVTESRTFQTDVLRGAVAPSGTVWLAAGDEGLWRRDINETWTQVWQEPTTAVGLRGAEVWFAHPAHAPGQAVVRAGVDGGPGWDVLWEAPEAWEYPIGCATKTAQICADDEAALMEALGLAEPEDPPPAGGGGGGCQSTPTPLWLAPTLVILGLWVTRRRWWSSEGVVR